MFPYRALKKLFDGHLQESATLASGRLSALREFHQHLGLSSDHTGRASIDTDDRGLPTLGSGRLRPGEVSLRHLAEAIMGHDFVNEYYHPSGGFDFSSSALREAALDPTSFININTFNLATSGLVNAQIIERFNQPEFIGRKLVKIVPTNMNGHKQIGVSRLPKVTKAAKGRQPGETHTEIGFGDVYTTTPATEEQALKCRVTREAVFFDLTNQVLDEAGMVGEELAYTQEIDIADMIMGVTNSYNRNGTSYNTYQTSSPWINDHSNPFSDENDIDDARQLFIGMTDPDTGKEIVINGYQILCMPARELKFRQGLFGSQVQMGTQLNSNFPSRWMTSTPKINEVGGGAYTVTPVSAIWYNRATASDGLNLSASNAKEYWWLGDFQGAFEWHENWPITPWMASADEYVMKDQGLVAVYGANYRGASFAKEPRKSIRNKN